MKSQKFSNISSLRGSSLTARQVASRERVLLTSSRSTANIPMTRPEWQSDFHLSRENVQCNKDEILRKKASARSKNHEIAKLDLQMKMMALKNGQLPDDDYKKIVMPVKKIYTSKQVFVLNPQLESEYKKPRSFKTSNKQVMALKSQKFTSKIKSKEENSCLQQENFTNIQDENRMNDVAMIKFPNQKLDVYQMIGEGLKTTFFASQDALEVDKPNEFLIQLLERVTQTTNVSENCNYENLKNLNQPQSNSYFSFLNQNNGQQISESLLPNYDKIFDQIHKQRTT